MEVLHVLMLEGNELEDTEDELVWRNWRGVRAWKERRLVLEPPGRVAESGLGSGGSAIRDGFGSRESWAACGNGSGWSRNINESSDTEF